MLCKLGHEQTSVASAEFEQAAFCLDAGMIRPECFSPMQDDFPARFEDLVPLLDPLPTLAAAVMAG